MLTLKHISFASMLVFALLTTAAAQESTSATIQPSSLTITAAAAGERVRITAPSSVVQMHVEVYAASGEKLFDQEIRGGNVFDWHLQDGQAQRLAPGNYVCVVTAKSISGKLTQKIGTVSVEDKSVSVQPAESKHLSAPQAQTIGPVEENSSWIIAGKDEPQTPTVIAHDGTDGQMIRGRGALTFRIGDFFSGNDKEQMRLTEDGNLGIGTTKPTAKLDVAGMIRAREGFMFSDGSMLKLNEKGVLTRTNADGVAPSSVTTQNQIAKFTDNAGTVGDSMIAESGGSVAIGGPVIPGVHFDFRQSNPTGDVLQRIWNEFGDLTPRPLAGAKLRYVAAVGGTSQLQLTDNAEWLMSIAGNNQIGMQFRVRDTTDPNTEAGLSAAARMAILRNGNVGIGTPTPTAKLDVAGDINVAGNAVIAGNIAAKYQDVAEWVQARTPIAPGTLVILDPGLANAVVPSGRAYDTHVAGVISARPGVILGEAGTGKVLVATTGRVKVKVDATRIPIKIGDLLVTSDKPGVAMKSLPIMVRGVPIHRPGTIVGKALEPLPKGAGEIYVLLSLQ